VQLHFKLSYLSLKVLHSVMVLLLVLRGIVVKASQEILNALFKVLVVPCQSLVQPLLELYLCVFPCFVFPYPFILLFFLPCEFSNKNLSRSVSLFNYSLELSCFGP